MASLLGLGSTSPLPRLTSLLGACRFFFRSGNIEHPEDKLFNTSVEVLPFDVSMAGTGESRGCPLLARRSNPAALPPEPPVREGGPSGGPLSHSPVP